MNILLLLDLRFLNRIFSFLLVYIATDSLLVNL